MTSERREQHPRVLHIISRLSYYGAENVVHMLADEMHRRGRPVGILTLYPSPNTERSAPPFPFYPIARRGRGDPFFFFRMLAAIRHFRPDIVHTHVHNGKYWGRLAAVAGGVRHIVHTEHDSNFRAHPVARLANYFLHPRTQRFITFTQTHAEALQRSEPVDRARLRIVPNGISADECRGATLASVLGQSEGPTIAHVGRLRTVKNQRLALEILAALRRALPHARLAMIGDGEDRAMLEAHRRELGLDSCAYFLGFRPDARSLLSSADALLVTSLNEAMPLAVMEALMAGIPVVTTPWGGASDILAGGRFGAIAENYDPDVVAQTVQNTLADPATPARSAQAKDFARDHYGINRCADRHAELYDNLLR